MLVSWELITQYLLVVCAGQLVPHVSKFVYFLTLTGLLISKKVIKNYMQS